MESPRMCLVVLVSVSLVSVSIADLLLEPEGSMMVSPELAAQSQNTCTELAKDPYFEPEMVVGVPWRVYYAWKMDLNVLCIDINFKIATPSIIRRFYYDMNEYLLEQPAWGAASLLLNMGRFQREMLLFDDQGPAGRFIAVPNVVRDGSLKMRSPLFNFQVKLERNGKYMILVDCQVGVASLSARADQKPDRAEIESVAAALSPLLGEGFNACVEQKDLASDLNNK